MKDFYKHLSINSYSSIEWKLMKVSFSFIWMMSFLLILYRYNFAPTPESIFKLFPASFYLSFYVKIILFFCRSPLWGLPPPRPPPYPGGPRPRCRPRHTTPIPPRPSSSKISQSPSTRPVSAMPHSPSTQAGQNSARTPGGSVAPHSGHTAARAATTVVSSSAECAVLCP